MPQQSRYLCFSDRVVQGYYLSVSERKHLCRNLETDLRPEYRLRIEIMLLADTGRSQTQICQVLGCSVNTARYWIGMLRAGQSQKWADQPIGRPKTISKQYLNRLQELVNRSPRDCGYAFQKWTAHWLSKHLLKELGIEVSARYVDKLLKNMNLSTRIRSKIVD